MYDTHCHPYLAQKKSQKSIIQSAYTLGMFLNCIGIDIESSQNSVDIAVKNKNIYASVGIHPSYAKDYKYEKINDIINQLESLYIQNKEQIVAIGESGLDYFYLGEKSWNNDIPLSSPEEKDIQKNIFIAQIRLAKKHKLPIIIHNREAKDDILFLLKKENYKNFILHCFCENIEFANKCLQFSPECKISFSGIVTFNSAKEIQQVATEIPLKNIIIETDSPYLTPVPLRGKEENEPIFVQHVLDKIIDLREESSESIKNQILENSKKVFNIE